MPWPALLAATRPVLAWRTLVAAGGAALAVTALLAVLPAPFDTLLPGLAVLVLACGLGGAADDGTAALTTATPVTVRRRLLARAALALPVSATGLTGVVLLAAAGGAHPGWGLVRLWAALGVLALAVGAVGRRAGVPGTVSATLLLSAGLVLHMSLPEAVLRAAPWNSPGKRFALVLAVAAVALAWATRDPAARGERMSGSAHDPDVAAGRA
ncbi:hypothetical protein ACI797_08270 [Geodermatophilus sp. SYSU D00691]